MKSPISDFRDDSDVIDSFEDHDSKFPWKQSNDIPTIDGWTMSQIDDEKRRMAGLPLSPPDKKQPKTTNQKAKNDFNQLLKKKTGSLNGGDSDRDSHQSIGNKPAGTIVVHGNIMGDDSDEEDEESEMNDSDEEIKWRGDIQQELLKIKEIKRWDLA